jgi:hypothetical protein
LGDDLRELPLQYREFCVVEIAFKYRKLKVVPVILAYLEHLITPFVFRNVVTNKVRDSHGLKA